MNKCDLNWEEFAKELLWREIVYHKNEDSEYDVTLGDKREIGRWRFSASPVPYKALTWKELALELGLFEEYLVNDGHDCHKCDNEKNCIAYFKYDKDHETCNYWQKAKRKKELLEEIENLRYDIAMCADAVMVGWLEKKLSEDESEYKSILKNK